MSLNKYVCFYLGDELFVIPLSSVSEVYQLDNSLAQATTDNEIYLGKFTAGDNQVPMLDLGKVVGRNINNFENMNESCVLLFNLPDGPWAALVDSLEGIVTIDSKDIQRCRKGNSPVFAKASGIKRTYFLIDPERMINKIDRLRWGTNSAHQEAA